jgi:Effector Associated Constant Component 1
MDVTVSVDAGAEDGLRAELGDELRDALLESADLDAVHPAPGGPAPDGAKSLDLPAWGTVLVSVASAASLRSLVDAVSSWLRRQPRDVSVAVDGVTFAGPVSAEERAALVAAITERLRKSGGGSGPE